MRKSPLLSAQRPEMELSGGDRFPECVRAPHFTLPRKNGPHAGNYLLTLRLLADIQMNHLPFCFRFGDGKVSEADGGEPRVMSVSETRIGQLRCLYQAGLEDISLGRPSRDEEVRATRR